MKVTKKIMLVLSMIMVLSMSTGCVKPYDKPEFVTIEASQTAFLIPLQGNVEDQGVFESEELLKQAKVPTKEVQITHVWRQTGRMQSSGSWVPNVKLIIVERKPVTREWTADNTGTSTANQGISAESLESIGFTVSMSITAQIDEENATKYLYRYGQKTLDEVMDTEIRATVDSKFVEECGKLTMQEIISNKATIMEAVRSFTVEKFLERGITITVLGMKDGIVYDDVKIQESINASFTAQKLYDAQIISNKTAVEKAEADKTVKITEAEAEAQAVSIIQEQLSANPTYVEYIKAMKWDGVMPKVVGANGMILDVGNAE